MIKVLIAEDEPLSLQNLTGHLRRLLGADALIEGAANGREAVDMARRIRPQLVLMDIEMPVMTGLDAAAIKDTFNNMLGNPGLMTFFAVLAILIAFGICALGLQNGVERITKVVMSLLLCLIVILAIHSFALPNASEGIKFYLVPNIELVKKSGIGEAVFAAMTHAFFTLSIGMGAMEIFGSYLDKKRSLTGEAISIVLLVTFVALMA